MLRHVFDVFFFLYIFVLIQTNLCKWNDRLSAGAQLSNSVWLGFMALFFPFCFLLTLNCSGNLFVHYRMCTGNADSPDEDQVMDNFDWKCYKNELDSFRNLFQLRVFIFFLVEVELTSDLLICPILKYDLCIANKKKVMTTRKPP